MKKLAFYINQIEKVAISKARKMYNSGLLSRKSQEKLFSPIKVADNINNKINARNLRQVSGAWPKSPLTASRYKKLGKVDSLPERAPLDSRRFSKASGRQNSEMISELRKSWPEGAKVSYHGEGYRGSANINIGEKGILGADITLPKKNLVPADIKNPNRQDRVGKEMRSFVARHEISGEAAAARKIDKMVGKLGGTTEPGHLNMFRHSSHFSPEIPVGDAQLYKNFSPTTKKIIHDSQLSSPAKHLEGKQGLIGKLKNKVMKPPSELEDMNKILGKPPKTPLVESNISDEQVKKLNRVMLDRNIPSKDSQNKDAFAEYFTHTSPFGS